MAHVWQTAAAAALTILMPDVAAADLVEVDLSSPGDALITRDTFTGLEWLDTTETAGLSFNQINAGAGGWVADGWRHATTDEVCNLFSTYVSPFPCPGQALGDKTKALFLQSFIGAPGGSQHTQALFADGIAPPSFEGDGALVFTTGGNVLLVVNVNNFNSDAAGASLGHYLVRDAGASQCGNGIVESGEECDDGNNLDGDGCSSTCQLEGDGLIAHWTISPGDRFNDVVPGGGHNPTEVQNVTLVSDRFEEPNSAAYFGGFECVDPTNTNCPPPIDKPTSFLRILNTPDLNPSEFSVNLWFKHDKVESDDGESQSVQLLLFDNHKQLNPNDQRGYEVYIERRRPVNQAFAAAGAGLPVETGDNFDAWCFGQWHMLTATFDGSSLKLYVDAVLEAEGPTTLQEPNHTDLCIGVTNCPGSVNHNFIGWMDDIRLYDRPLGDSEINELLGGWTLCQPPDKDQRKCINSLNKNLAKVAKAEGKDICDCIKDFAKGKSLSPAATLEECLTADRKGRVAKAKGKTVSDAAKICSTMPDFGPTGPNIVNSVAVQKELDLMHVVFGSDLDLVIATEVLDVDKGRSKCQQAVAKSVKKCQDVKLKEFNKCKKAGLKDQSILSFVDLEDCMGVDPKGKIAKTCDPVIGKIRSTINKKCGGVDFPGAFPQLVAIPGCGTDDPAMLAACLDQIVECQVCLALNQADALSRDCDDFDDGAVNGSCADTFCGNGVLDPGEACDDLNNVDGDGCSADCQLEGRTCGGLIGLLCSEGEFCEFPPDTCGFADLLGVCVEAPVPCVCPEIFDPVCGCDGVTYANDCFRRCARISFAHGGEC